MIDATKFQYYTHAHRMRGFAAGLEERRGPDDPLIYMLTKAAALLEHAWDEYQASLPPDQRIGS